MIPSESHDSPPGDGCCLEWCRLTDSDALSRSFICALGDDGPLPVDVEALPDVVVKPGGGEELSLDLEGKDSDPIAVLFPPWGIPAIECGAPGSK